MFEADGALWMRTTDFGDDRDRVLVRHVGEYTYFASDTAYYVDKRERGFSPCIYLLGADHHGYVGRLRVLAACAGDDPDRDIEVLIGQLVTILRGGEELRLSKRAGTILSLREVIDLTGVDALALHAVPLPGRLTADPRRRGRHPHRQRQPRLLRAVRARPAVVDPAQRRRPRHPGGSGGSVAAYDPAVLDHEREGELLRALAEMPAVVQRAATLREPHRVARYLEDTAATFHRFYDDCRVLPMGDEVVTDVHRARLVLVAATRLVLANGLRLLGVDAPERM